MYRQFDYDVTNTTLVSVLVDVAKHVSRRRSGDNVSTFVVVHIEIDSTRAGVGNNVDECVMRICFVATKTDAANGTGDAEGEQVSPVAHEAVEGLPASAVLLESQGVHTAGHVFVY